MKRMLAAMAAMMLAGAAPAETQPLSRYQSIIDRQMFGKPPSGFDPNQNPNEVKGGKGAEKNLTEEQEKLQHSVRFSMINITPSGDTAVGFTDNTDGKNPVHYYLKVGEKRNGWEVKEADPVRAWMRLAKGDVEVELELGGTSGGANAGKVKAEMMAQADSAAPQPKILPATGADMPLQRNTLLAGGNSLRSRRAQRAAMEEERKRAADEARARQEEEREEIRNDFMAMREEMRLQREEAFMEMERRREEERMELERRREEDERRRREEEDRKEPESQSEEVKE